MREEGVGRLQERSRRVEEGSGGVLQEIYALKQGAATL